MSIREPTPVSSWHPATVIALVAELAPVVYWRPCLSLPNAQGEAAGMRSLFQRALGGDVGAEVELDRIIRRIARAVCHNTNFAAGVDWEDIAQEASKRFFSTGIHQFGGRGSEESYLYAIVRTTLLEAVRRANRRRRHDDQREPAVHLALTDPHPRIDVENILRQLSTECARLLDQVYLQGVPYGELALELEMLESSVRVRVSRCLRKAMDIARGDAR